MENPPPPKNQKQTKRDKHTLNLLKRLLKSYIYPYKAQLMLAILCMIIASAMTAGIARLMQPILDDVINGNNTALIIPVASAFLAVFITRGAAAYGSLILMNKVSQFMIGDIQKDLFRHFQTLDLAFFHANPSGNLMSLVVNDVNVLRTAIAGALTGVGKSFITLVFLVVVMFTMDTTLAIAAFTIFPFAALFVAYLGRKLRKISKGLQANVASLSDHLAKIFQGVRVVKAYGMEKYEQERADKAISDVRKINIKAVRVGALSTPVNESLVGLVMFGVIIYGGFQASSGEMTAGQLGAFLTAFIMSYEPMKKLARLNNSIQLGLGAAERIFAMLDTKPTIKQNSRAKTLKTQKPKIIFKNVGFQYDGADIKALSDISFTAKPGKVTALVGPSGGGKSTVLNLIPRFYDAETGNVTIDGLDIKDVKIKSLRDHIALVSQDITIFDNTIEANIAYGREGASQKEIESAAKAAAAHDFITALPDGYQTHAGEDGVKLSGGQRQRIAIARAILRNAPILLLDEATSALDNESEKAVQGALKKLEKGRTTIVIAHRLSTVQNADQILVLDKGKITERGTHEDLLKNSKLYAKMHKAGFEA